MPKPGSRDASPDDVLSDAELKALCQRAIVRSFAKNTVVVSEGDRTDSLYIVVSGRVKIYVSDDQGKEMILNQAGAGEYFGEMVLDAGPRSASVMTLEPTRFLVVPKEDFAAFLANSPEFALHLIRKLIRRVRGLTHDIKSLALMDVYGRVARMLLELADAAGNGEPRRRVAGNDQPHPERARRGRLHRGGARPHHDRAHPAAGVVSSDQ
jgi:CRP/FNR family cyclic AMP-dependent transcriptional regulator